MGRIKSIMNTKSGAQKIASKHLGITLEQYRDRLANGEKWCSRCKSWKPLVEFGLDRTRGDGLDASCFACRRVKVRINIKGRPSAFKGKHHTPEVKATLSALAKNRRNPFRKRLTFQQRQNISEGTKKKTPRGENHPRWKGGISPENEKERYSFEYEEWRKKVFERDHFTCQVCGYDKGHILIAHHLKSFSEYPELRFDIDNGLTVCKACHNKLHPERNKHLT